MFIRGQPGQFLSRAVTGDSRKWILQPQPGQRRSVCARRKQFDLDAAPQKSAQHFLRVNRATFLPEHRHAPVGTNVRDPHQFPLAGRRAA